MQFPHVSNTPLYTPNIKPNSSFTNQKYVLGKMWEKFVIPNNVFDPTNATKKSI
jgi:hypothetical protein